MKMEKVSNMSVKQHRERLYEVLEDNSLVILHAGVPLHTNEDDYYAFEVNSQFFYLTGLEREKMVFLAAKLNGQVQEMLLIEPADPAQERWTGKMPTKEEASAQSGIEKIGLVGDLEAVIGRWMGRYRVHQVYFDLYRCGAEDLPDYNALQAEAFRRKYPSVVLKDLHEVCVPLREVKDAEEIEKVRSAIGITRQGLEYVMKTLKPGMKEYQAQANFEYTCRSLGAVRMAFPTISAAGLNGCMMHYNTNRAEIPEGKLLLMDLGAKYENYCSDISRTFPANGKYTPRQRQIYDLVLRANRSVAEYAKPGLTLKDLNDHCRQILAEGLMELGLIEKAEDVGKYYMHGVSHSIGIDCHDACFTGDVLQPGWIISDEPGLYIDEEEIGIRIEDDLLITEDGCEVLSREIPSDPEEIERMMQAR